MSYILKWLIVLVVIIYTCDGITVETDDAIIVEGIKINCNKRLKKRRTLNISSSLK